LDGSDNLSVDKTDGNDDLSVDKTNGVMMPAMHLFGGNGDDKLTGGSRDDFLFGQAGSDQLFDSSQDESPEFRSGCRLWKSPATLRLHRIAIR
jgi:Ca2+-binding RTX toxin-like protein